MTDLSKIYSAVYSGVPVFEMVVNDVAVMRRRTDSYMNATQILKVANIEKGKRTKILEKEVLIGEHEKVQGGYGKYQGTWIPFEKSKELAEKYGVLTELSPIFNFELSSLGTDEGDDVLTKEQAIAARKKLNPPEPTNTKPQKQKNSQKTQATSPQIEEQPRKKVKTSAADESIDDNTTSDERDRSILMSIFLSDSTDQIPDILKTTQEKSGFNIDMVIDEQGYTALHWATALARTKTVELLVARGANIACTSYTGETPLMRGVMVTNSYDNNSFPEIFNLLKETLPIVDNRKRSVLHHAALTAGIHGRTNAAVYYMKILLDHLANESEETKSIINAQDSTGDTALNIAARLECEPLVELLLKAGAIQYTENNNGLQVKDYSDKDVNMEEASKPQRVFSNTSLYSKKPYAPSQRGKEIIATVQKIVDALDDEYGGLLTLKEQELKKVQDDLNAVTKELEDTRKGLEERQAQSQTLSEAQQKTKNIESIIQAGWNQLEEDMKKAGKAVPDPSEIEKMDENEDIDVLFDAPPLAIPEDATEDERKKLLEDYTRSIQAKIKAYTTNDIELQQEIKKLEDQFIEKEMQCKRLIAACCNLPIDKIDDLVEPLTLAIESDPPDLDLARVIGFMDKIRRQGAFTEPTTGPSSIPVPAPTVSRTISESNNIEDDAAPTSPPDTEMKEEPPTTETVLDTADLNEEKQSTNVEDDVPNPVNNTEHTSVKDTSLAKDEVVEMTPA